MRICHERYGRAHAAQEATAEASRTSAVALRRRDDQAQAHVELVEPAEPAVTAIPRSIREVARDLGDDAIDDLPRHAREARGRGARVRIQHALGVGPEGAEHPVLEVARDRDWLDRHVSAEPLLEERERG